MAAGGTNIFFVPYRPNSRSRKASSKDENEISQQKHAAREYHRKVKLERVAKQGAFYDRSARSTSVPAAQSQSQSDTSSRPLLPRNRSFPGDQDYDKSFAVFDAGTGQLDPFNACVPSGVPAYALDILDYATLAQWKIFSSERGVNGEGNIKNAVLGCAMQSPAAFWSIIFAGATHNACLQRGVNVPSSDTTLRLSCKTNAIRELNREIYALKGGVASDELLLAIITMAAHGTGEQLDPLSAEEKLSTLESVQNFQYYGRMHWERAHFKAIAHLIYQKGGLHTVKMPGLANAIGLADIFLAFQDLRPPAFPLLVPSSLIMSTWPVSQVPLAPSRHGMTSGFDEFRDSIDLGPLMQIIANARLITIGFHAYLSKHPDAPTITRIVWARNFMTHDLLSLPLTLLDPSFDARSDPQLEEPSSSTVNIFSPAHSLYNLIRLATLTYTLLVLFPLPRVTGVHTKLSQQLMLALDDCTVLDLWSSHPKLLLWATILGGIASEDGSLKSWFAEMTRQARTKMPNLALMDSATRARSRSTSRQRSHNRSLSFPEAAAQREADAAWTVVRDICFRFLWFDGPECDGAGRAFWNEACETALMRTRSDEPSASMTFFESVV